jgi:hypothetical protein
MFGLFNRYSSRPGPAVSDPVDDELASSFSRVAISVSSVSPTESQAVTPTQGSPLSSRRPSVTVGGYPTSDGGSSSTEELFSSNGAGSTSGNSTGSPISIRSDTVIPDTLDLHDHPAWRNNSSRREDDRESIVGDGLSTAQLFSDVHSHASTLEQSESESIRLTAMSATATFFSSETSSLIGSDEDDDDTATELGGERFTRLQILQFMIQEFGAFVSLLSFHRQIITSGGASS